MGIAGALLTWAGLRWLILAAIVVGVWALVANWGRGVLAADPLDLPSAYQRSGTVLLLVTVIIVVSLGLTIVLATIRFGAESVDAGLPSLLAATSASIGVARWVGHADSDPVIRLSAPLGISVVGFKADGQLQALAVIVAAEQAAVQLDSRYDNRRNSATPTLDILTGISDPETIYLERFRKTVNKKDPSSTSGPMFLALLWGIFLISLFWIVPSVEAIVLSLLIGIPFTWWVIALLVRGRMYNQAMRADIPSPPNPLWRLIPGIVLFALGYAALGNPQSFSEGDVIETGGLVLGQFWEFAAGIFLIAGVACILSGLSRISARLTARRYKHEVDGFGVDDDTDVSSGKSIESMPRVPLSSEQRAGILKNAALFGGVLLVTGGFLVWTLLALPSFGLPTWVAIGAQSLAFIIVFGALFGGIHGHRTLLTEARASQARAIGDPPPPS